jgi:hypothetical protein
MLNFGGGPILITMLFPDNDRSDFGSEDESDIIPSTFTRRVPPTSHLAARLPTHSEVAWLTRRRQARPHDFRVNDLWHTAAMATRWWYTQTGTIVGFLADDGKWFYKQSGQTIGYIDGTWIYAPDGTPIGYFGDAGWIFSPDGEPLGYLQP